MHTPELYIWSVIGSVLMLLFFVLEKQGPGFIDPSVRDLGWTAILFLPWERFFPH
jgi:hypothetical protein